MSIAVAKRMWGQLDRLIREQPLGVPMTDIGLLMWLSVQILNQVEDAEVRWKAGNGIVL
jgi:hypothetical protein